MPNLRQLTFAALAALSCACSAEGRLFSRVSHLSNKRDVDDLCASSPGVEVSCADLNNEDGLAAHSGDCRLFFQCVSDDGAPVCRQCPPALHFNPSLRVCDLPERAGCASVDANDVVPKPAGPADDIPPRCVNNSRTAVTCVNETSPDALLPHPDDCELFYYCVSPESKPICRQCNAGLHFNPLLHVCDKPEDADCRSIPSNPDGGDVSGPDDSAEIPIMPA